MKNKSMDMKRFSYSLEDEKILAYMKPIARGKRQWREEINRLEKSSAAGKDKSQQGNSNE